MSRRKYRASLIKKHETEDLGFFACGSPHLHLCCVVWKSHLSSLYFSRVFSEDSCRETKLKAAQADTEPDWLVELDQQTESEAMAATAASGNRPCGFHLLPSGSLGMLASLCPIIERSSP